MKHAKLPRDRFAVFLLQMVYLAALVTLAILYFTDTIHPRHRVGSVHIAIPWFGALGATIISLQGIFDHPYDWNPGWRLWHISRPLVGAVVGTIGVMIFQAGILAVGADPNEADRDAIASSKDVLYYLIAFLVGYREATFREMIKRLVDVVFSSGQTATAAPVILGVDPPKGPVTGGGAVTITGRALTGTQSVKFGAAQVAFERRGDTEIVVTDVPATGQAGPEVVTVTLSDGRPAYGVYVYEDVAPAPQEPAPTS